MRDYLDVLLVDESEQRFERSVIYLSYHGDELHY